MADHTNAFTRIQKYFALMHNEKGLIPITSRFNLGISMSDLCTYTNIPIRVIHNDINAIMKWQYNIQKKCIIPSNSPFLADPNRIAFDEDSPQYMEANEKYGLDNLTCPDDAFSTELEVLINNGSLDDIPIFIDNCGTKFYQLDLTPEETNALYSFRENESSLHKTYDRFHSSFDSVLQIKDSYKYNHQYNNLLLNLNIINNAITEKYCLDMVYTTSQQEKLSIVFYPKKIVYDNIENLYYVLSYADDKISSYRLDHIISINASNQNLPDHDFVPPVPMSKVWGCCFSEKCEHVKIRFYNEANVWQKVRKDLSYRDVGTLYEKDGFLYYEDDVYGISKLRPWLYGFGSSAIVLEPESLRQQVMESLKARLEG